MLNWLMTFVAYVSDRIIFLFMWTKLNTCCHLLIFYIYLVIFIFFISNSAPLGSMKRWQTSQFLAVISASNLFCQLSECNAKK